MLSQMQIFVQFYEINLTIKTHFRANRLRAVSYLCKQSLPLLLLCDLGQVMQQDLNLMTPWLLSRTQNEG